MRIVLKDVRYPFYRGPSAGIVSAHVDSSNRSVHQHHMYPGYDGHFAAIRADVLLIAGHSNNIRPFDESGIVSNMHGTYRKQPIERRSLGLLKRGIRRSLHSQNLTRIASSRINGTVLGPLHSLSIITCLQFTDICRGFTNLRSFRDTVSNLHRWCTGTVRHSVQIVHGP